MKTHVASDFSGLEVVAGRVVPVAGGAKQLVEELRADKRNLIRALRVAAAIFEAPANRFGKPEFYDDDARAARAELLTMARAYDVTPSETVLEQAGKVMRAALAKVGA